MMNREKYQGENKNDSSSGALHVESGTSLDESESNANVMNTNNNTTNAAVHSSSIEEHDIGHTSSGDILNYTSPPRPKQPTRDPSDMSLAADYTSPCNKSLLDLYNDSEEQFIEGKGWLFERSTQTMMVVFPKVEPLHWSTFFMLSVTCAGPVLAYLILFTKMGFGLTTMYYLSTRFSHYTPFIIMSMTVLFFLLYLLDSETWTSRVGSLCRTVGIALIVIGIFTVILFSTGEYPYGPICLFTISTPMWLLLLKNVFYQDLTTRVYVSWLSGPLFFLSVLTGVAWVAWAFGSEGNNWNSITRLADVDMAGCTPDFSEYPDCHRNDEYSYYSDNNEQSQACFDINDSATDIYFPDGCAGYCVEVYDKCLNTFILWVGPLLVSISLFFLSFFTTFLRANSEKDLISFAKLWLFLLFAMWCAASLAGAAGSGITFALAALTLACFVGSGVFLSVSIGKMSESNYAMVQSLLNKYEGQVDVARGLLIVTCAPVVLLYVALSSVNQCVRKMRHSCCEHDILHTNASDNLYPGCFSPESQKNITPSEQLPSSTTWLTLKTASQVAEFKKWDRAKVYTYAVYWGVAFMTLNVIVAEFTIVLMSWLIEVTQSFPLWAVTAVTVAVGLVMFLLPPVPGVPIYLTLGIVTVATGRESLGIIGAMVYGTVTCLFLKLLACTLQQKLIGENLSHFVSIRKLVQVNSTFIRAMKLVLSEEGFSVPKVAILVGGPDWPTSVLCGIMRLELFAILLGTVPVIFLIVPTMLTGSFAYMASLKNDGIPEYPWAGTVGTIFAAITAIVQFGSMLVAAYYLERVTNTRQQELEQIPIDKEVKQAEDALAYSNEVYTDITRWKHVPIFAKMLLTTSLAAMVASCYIVQLFSHYCFVDYDLTHSVNQDLDGNVLNLILLLGEVALWLFMLACALLWVFHTWAMNKTNIRVKERTASMQENYEKKESLLSPSLGSPLP